MTEEEILQTRIFKGKQIYADEFVNTNSGIWNFWPEYSGMHRNEMVGQITNHPDFKMHMNNLINKAREYKNSCSDGMCVCVCVCIP